MTTKKLTLEIPKELFEELEQLALLKGDSIESVIILSIATSLPSFRQKANDLDELLSRITEDNLHGEFDIGEPVGREIF
ncbi:hypothetical protein NIES4071_80790 [Calothrix sp. NIES-4071]|nr:hypothetical protein NIES4071_80790 [Calothrix sp. NIES-4071]BAZ62349.1 hypothetical protein NIES4105_80720 [Calothrix sp. NIES-4105]